jgi:hypothetical protein
VIRHRQGVIGVAVRSAAKVNERRDELKSRRCVSARARRGRA